MLKVFVLLLFSFSLYAIGYPHLYQEKAKPLFETRVAIDPLVIYDPLRERILRYETQSDRVLGKYRRVKKRSNKAQKQAYLKALSALEDSHTELELFFVRSLKTAIKEDDYPLFLALISLKDEHYFLDPYLREKIYTYYSAHRHLNSSCYLDSRIKKEWNTIAPYYPQGALKNYATTDNAYYREVILLSTKHSPYSAKVRTFLTKNNVRFKAYDIEESSEGLALFKQYSGKRIPLIIIDNNVVEGYNEYEMHQLLKR